MFHNPDLKVEMPPLPNCLAPAPACAEAVVGRRPRIAIMGEFSAGKSTLTNLLIGSNSLPTKVTATQLPPVWLSHGNGAPKGVDLSDSEFDVDFDQLADIPLKRTQYLRVQRMASVLEICDIIDFPGISDPNMPAEIWRRVISRADAVLWCSHAVQAWRQSEAAVWEEIPPELQERSFLLLTRMDKLTEERDRRRMLSRVRRETDGLFADVFPISLTRALAAGDDRAAWEESGAEIFMGALLDLVMTLSKQLGQEISPLSAINPEEDELWEEEEALAVAAPPVREHVTPSVADVSRPSAAIQAAPVPAPEPAHPAPQPGRIVPRRVSLKGAPRRARRPQTPQEAPDDLAEIFRQS